MLVWFFLKIRLSYPITGELEQKKESSLSPTYLRNDLMDWLGLSKKTVIVTGGASGIGKAVAVGFSEVGANVVIADMNQEAGEAAVSELSTESGNQHRFVSCNVTDAESVNQMIESASEITGQLDILVNNAGINIPRLLVDPAGKEEFSIDLWNTITTVNQTGVFLCTQAASRAMLKNEKGGVIVNMASESGLEGSEGQSAYAASKAALYSMTRSWAKELGKHGIRIVGLAPGILEVTGLRTEEYERALSYTRGITIEQLREGYKKQSIPLGRVGRLDEVADTVVYLASKRASYIHGTVINISGGKSRA